MDNRKKDERINSGQENQLRNIARLVDDHYELEKMYIKVVSELDLLKNRMKKLNHDLRNPLCGITGMIDLLIAEVDNSENNNMIEVKTRDLNIVKESAQSLLNLISGTLQMGGDQKGLNEMKSTEKTLSSAMMEINRLYLPMAQNKDLSLSLRTYINKEMQLSHDLYINLIQIIGNLVSNAVKFTPTSGSVNVVFTSDDNEEGQSLLHITVADTGRGLTSDQVSAFNEDRSVARSNGTNGEESFGIGLQHVKEMVSKENGHIVVKGEKDSGTFFSISLPLPDNNFDKIKVSNFTLQNGSLLMNGSQK